MKGKSIERDKISTAPQAGSTSRQGVHDRSGSGAEEDGLPGFYEDEITELNGLPEESVPEERSPEPSQRGTAAQEPPPIHAEDSGPRNQSLGRVGPGPHRGGAPQGGRDPRQDPRAGL